MTIIPENLSIHKPDKKLKEVFDKIDINEKVLFEID